MSFQNKKLIVTGAGRSIGRQIALSLAEQGADVVISYQSNAQGAQSVVDEMADFGIQAHALQADFSDPQQVEAFAEEAIARLGHVDHLVNNAGLLSRERLFELTPQAFERVMQVNVLAPWQLLQLTAKHMVSQGIRGSIVNVSSIAASLTFPKGMAYAASKAALNKITQSAALDLSEHGIRVIAVAPGVIEAGMNQDTG